jgi:hypothetical protein
MTKTRGYSALQAGLAYLPLSVAIILISGVASRLAARRAPRPMIVTGLAVAATGLAMLSRMRPDGSIVFGVIIPFLIIAVGPDWPRCRSTPRPPRALQVATPASHPDCLPPPSRSVHRSGWQCWSRSRRAARPVFSPRLVVALANAAESRADRRVHRGSARSRSFPRPLG